ncbi:hypothetical protein Vqi01_31110 [Micromonospora qiuiae]|uniref:DUF1570 domain-containing protein n=1 Tax=Micromonospora qiuiae TaxID=502268 RepID=A0ABQ4JCS5_9ACTN|nr:hypothetical protein [Micromonospora qiuiae]GIJ27949.1 hypothetical protein Vqi01_31110 [Micromonospora qiuiae]
MSTGNWLGTKAGGARLSRRGMLIAGGLLLAGCGGRERPQIESKDAGSTRDKNKRRLREILDRQAKAVKEKDEKAYLADLDSSNAELIEHERMVFANLRQFEFAEFGYNTQRLIAHGDHTFGPVFRIAQLVADESPVGAAPAETFRYRLAPKDGGQLVIAEITPATNENQNDAMLNGPLAHEAWNMTPLRVVQAAEDVWLVGDKSVPDLEKYARAAAAEAAIVGKLWGSRTRFPGNVMYLTRDDDNYREWFSLGRSSTFLPEISGFQTSRIGVRKNGQVYPDQHAGAATVINLKNIRDYYSGEDPRVTMHHELAHSVTAQMRATPSILSDLGAPTWAVEGFATWATGVRWPSEAGRYRRQLRANLGSFKGLPSSKNFYGAKRGFNYLLGWSVFAYIAQTKGRDAAVEFYAQVIPLNDTLEPFVELPIFDGICERALGTSAGAFLEGWKRFVRGGAGA